MFASRFALVAGCALLVLGAGPVMSARAQYATQAVSLVAGWNPVFVEVDPLPGELSTIFAGVAVKGVYGWDRQLQSQQFEIDPNTPLAPAAHWRVWKPASTSSVEASLNTLFSFAANSAYMVELASNAAPVTLQLKGLVRRPHLNWLPYSFNLVGFPTQPGTPATFAAMLGDSSEFNVQHKVPGHIFAIRTNGTAQQVDLLNQASATQVKPGIAYWVKGGSPGDFVSPLDFGRVNDLSFGPDSRVVNLEVRNRSSNAVTARVTHRASESAPVGYATPVAVPLAYYGGSVATNQTNWVTMGVGVTAAMSIPAKSSRMLAVAIRRSDVVNGGGPYASILELTDSATPSLRVRLPVMATDDSGTNASVNAQQGLWVGEARLSKVNAPYFQGTNALDAVGPFTLRVILHVDEAGQTRLLQSVVLGLLPAGLDASGLTTNLAYTLWSGLNVSIPTTAKQARRISSSGFPAMDPLLLSGNFSGGLSGQLVIQPNDPLNPFLHTFHPAHDNRNGQFVSQGTTPYETPRITRNISLKFNPPPADESGSIFGPDARTGTFREELLGLRRDTIIVEGPVRMSRLVKTGLLNP